MTDASGNTSFTGTVGDGIYFRSPSNAVSSYLKLFVDWEADVQVGGDQVWRVDLDKSSGTSSDQARGFIMSNGLCIDLVLMLKSPLSLIYFLLWRIDIR